MSMLAIESDKHLGLVGSEGALMITTKNITSSQGNASKQVATPRPPIHRGFSATDQMMYAWSMGAVRNANAGSNMVRAGKKEECPPEVYLG